MSRAITPKELSAHSTKNDLWFMRDGKVYDITKYVDEHPGGEDVLLDVAGGDGTEAFENAGHTKDALTELQKYYIGDLVNLANETERSSSL